MKKLKDIKDWKECINEVVCGDSLDLMRKIPDNAIDLCLTDPPYGLGDKLLKGGKKGNVVDFGKKYKDTKWEDIKPTQEFFDEIFRISKNQVIFGGNYFDLPPTRGIICWDKNIGTPHNFSHWEMAWTSFDCPARKFVRTNDSNKQHPTQKPLELMRWCLENYAKDCKTVIDPFAGSFTTAIACKDMGFDWIAIDQEEKYCEIGEKRLMQQNLF